MSGSLNKVMLIGNLGRDPELKMTTSGQALARFSVATTENWKTPQGEKKEKTEWHSIVVWGKQAEIAEKYLRKGKQVLIEGRIQYSEFTDQAGVKKTKAEIRCDNFVMLGRMEDGGARGAGSGGGDDYEHAGPSTPERSVGGSQGYEDDIPF